MNTRHGVVASPDGFSQSIKSQPDEPAMTIEDGKDDESHNERPTNGCADVVPRVVRAVDFVRTKVRQRFSVPFWRAGEKRNN